MGKGAIRTRRGKIWRGTYVVTRPRRYKTVERPQAATRKVKALKDHPKATAEAAVKKPEVVEETAEQVETVDTAEVAGEKAKKAPAAKKAPGVKKAPAAKKKKTED